MKVGWVILWPPLKLCLTNSICAANLDVSQEFLVSVCVYYGLWVDHIWTILSNKLCNEYVKPTCSIMNFEICIRRTSDYVSFMTSVQGDQAFNLGTGDTTGTAYHFNSGMNYRYWWKYHLTNTDLLRNSVWPLGLSPLLSVCQRWGTIKN